MRERVTVVLSREQLSVLSLDLPPLEIQDPVARVRVPSVLESGKLCDSTAHAIKRKHISELSCSRPAEYWGGRDRKVFGQGQTGK